MLTCRLEFDYIRQKKKQKAKTDFVAHCLKFLNFMFVCFLKNKNQLACFCNFLALFLNDET